MALFPKPQRYEDKEYLAWIRTLPCEAEGKECMGEIIYHHVEAYGTSIKCSDTFTIPLCVGHHDEIHRGAESFIKKYNFDLWRTIAKLITRYLQQKKS